MIVEEKGEELFGKYEAASIDVCDQVLSVLIKQHIYNEQLTNFWLDVRNYCDKKIKEVLCEL
jgi:hypothetical protein